MHKFRIGTKVVKKKYGDGTIYIVEKLMSGNWDMMLLRSTNPEHENVILVRQCQFRIVTKADLDQGQKNG